MSNVNTGNASYEEWNKIWKDDDTRVSGYYDDACKNYTSEVKISLTPRQSLAEAQESKVIRKSTLEQRILEQLNREFENLKENLDSLTVGDRLAVLRQLTTLVQELP